MKIMDCTMRDGANVLGNGFPKDLTVMMLKGLTDNGVSIIEYGNAKGLGAENLGFEGPVSDAEYLELVQPFLGKAEIGMFLNAKRYKKENVEHAAAKGLNFLRVGADAGDAEKYAEVIKKETLTHEIVYNTEADYSDTVINGENLKMTVEVVR